MADFDELIARFNRTRPIMVNVVNRNRTAEVLAVWWRGWVTVRFDSGATTDLQIDDVELINNYDDEK